MVAETRELAVEVSYSAYKTPMDKASISITPFPHCCGITILSSAAPECSQQYNSKDKVVEVHKKVIETALNDSECHKTGQLYALADFQEEDKEVLLALDFKPIHEFTNPNTDNKITIYFKDPCPEAYESDDDYGDECDCSDCR